MKKYLLFYLVIITISILSCTNDTKTIKWIEKAEKPIVIHNSPIVTINRNAYTLIDAKGRLYMTGDVRLSLPDTIKN